MWRLDIRLRSGQLDIGDNLGFPPSDTAGLVSGRKVPQSWVSKLLAKHYIKTHEKNLTTQLWERIQENTQHCWQYSVYCLWLNFLDFLSFHLITFIEWLCLIHNWNSLLLKPNWIYGQNIIRFVWLWVVRLVLWYKHLYKICCNTWKTCVLMW